MLSIDLKPAKNVIGSTGAHIEPYTAPKISNPHGLNAYNSLNRAVRIKEISRVADDNKSILGKLQSTKSVYSQEKWQKDFDDSRKIINNISLNSDRYCKNPYFLNSLCSKQNDPLSVQPYLSASNSKRALSSKKNSLSNASLSSLKKRLRRDRSTAGGARNLNNEGAMMGAFQS